MNPSHKRAFLFAALTAVASAAFTPAAYADVASLNASQDATIFATSTNVDTGNASGGGPATFAGADGQGNKERSLVEFNLSSIPAGATITGVTMTLYLAQIAGSGGPGGGGKFPSRTLHLFDLLQPWTEGPAGTGVTSIGGAGQGFARSNGDVTWDYASYNTDPALAVKWNNGSDLHGANFSSNESAESTFTTFVVNNPYTWSSPGMITDVQSWLNGTVPNDGWLLKSDLETSATSFLGFYTREGAPANGLPALAPNLSVTYTLAAPEPATLTLFAIAAPLLLARCRNAHQKDAT